MAPWKEKLQEGNLRFLQTQATNCWGQDTFKTQEMSLHCSKRNFFLQNEAKEDTIKTTYKLQHHSIPGLQEKSLKVKKVKKHLQKAYKFTRKQWQCFYKKCLDSTTRDLAQIEQQWYKRER